MHLQLRRRETDAVAIGPFEAAEDAAADVIVAVGADWKWPTDGDDGADSAGFRCRPSTCWQVRE